MRAYVDTNILVDLVLSRQEFLPDAQRVFTIGYAGEAQLVVSALSFVNTVYLGRKYKFPMDDVLSKLRMIADFVDVADLSGQNVVDMLTSGWRDYEDATQHTLGSHAKIVNAANYGNLFTTGPAEFIRYKNK